MDRRKTARYQLYLPVLFRWVAVDGTCCVEGGFTRDISLGGLYLVSAAMPPVGSAVQIEVLLPLGRTANTGALRLRAAATVVRSGGSREVRGFAAAGMLDTLDTLDPFREERSIDDGLVRGVKAS